jgi:mycofactocin precursor
MVIRELASRKGLIGGANEINVPEYSSLSDETHWALLEERTMADANTPTLDTDESAADETVVEEVLVEEISIDGMCGVY